jgi:hypothetical protein
MKCRPPKVRALLGSIPAEKLALLRSAFSARRQAVWRARLVTTSTTRAHQHFRVILEVRSAQLAHQRNARYAASRALSTAICAPFA